MQGVLRLKVSNLRGSLQISYLIKSFKDHNLRPNNNIVENIIKQLNQKFKKVTGFEFYETACNSIKLLVMRYVFIPLTVLGYPAIMEDALLNWLE